MVRLIFPPSDGQQLRPVNAARSRLKPPPPNTASILEEERRIAEGRPSTDPHELALAKRQARREAEREDG